MNRLIIWIAAALLASGLLGVAFVFALCLTRQDEGMAYVESRGGVIHTDGAPLFRLYDIYWTSAEVSDAELGRLSQTENINILDLSKNPLITDAGLATISGFRSRIELLDVEETSVTLDGLKRFLAKKPECDVIWAGQGWP